jgi:predicted AlkP superfamily phosphohydrolase/phosphomutase
LADGHRADPDVTRSSPEARYCGPVITKARLAVTALVSTLGVGSAWLLAPAPEATHNESYALMIVVDGAKGDTWMQYAREGKLPNTKRIFIDGGVWVDHATSVFPTITGAGLPAALTGAVPGRHGIPSLYFFDRVEQRYPVLYVALEAFEWDDWLSPDVKTVWEHFDGPNDTLAIGPALSRGADSVVPFTWNLGYKPIEFRGKVQVGIRKLKRAFSGAQPARMTVIYNGWFDHMEHGLGATAAGMDPHYEAIDDLIGESVDLFQKTMDEREEAIGHPVKRYIALVSDHGHQDIKEVYSIDKFVRQEKQAKVLDKAWTEAFGVKLRGAVPDDFTDREIVLASGEGHALLYLPTPIMSEDGETVVARDWEKRPSLAQLRDYPYQGGRIDIVGTGMAWRESVRFMLAKDHATGLVHVFGPDGESTIERRGEDATRADYRYTVVTGRDPLQYADDPAIAKLVDGGFHHADAWQLATYDTEAPDGPVMLYQAFDVEDRAPDLYISAAPFISIGDLVDGEKSASKHGGLTKDESWSTVAFAGTGVSQGRVATARNIDVVPTLLELLGQPYDPQELDGRSLRAVLGD